MRRYCAIVDVRFLSYMVVQYIISKVFLKQNFLCILFFEIPTGWRHNNVISNLSNTIPNPNLAKIISLLDEIKMINC